MPWSSIFYLFFLKFHFLTRYCIPVILALWAKAGGYRLKDIWDPLLKIDTKKKLPVFMKLCDLRAVHFATGRALGALPVCNGCSLRNTCDFLKRCKRSKGGGSGVKSTSSVTHMMARSLQELWFQGRHPSPSVLLGHCRQICMQVKHPCNKYK